jgi:membrane protein YdbS with pleckstrin-like domain
VSAPRPSSVRRSLASIVLGFELIVVFLATLVIFGLSDLPAWVTLGGGALLCLIMVATLGLLRYNWAYAIGWAIQVIIVATGFLNPAMFVVGALFAGMWVYCMINGSKIDRAHKENT